jgi:NADH-quinone oxidoreductase subunit J
MHPHYFLSLLIVLFAIGVITIKKPVYSALCFLGTLLSLSAYYFELSAEFIGTMQILVYAGAILVVFMFVMILFQDAYQKIAHNPANSAYPLLAAASIAFLAAAGFFSYNLIGMHDTKNALPANFGTVQSLGKSLYVDFFFPFEAVVIIFLVACVGALYIGKKET